MVVDTSAIIAILQAEPEKKPFTAVIASAEKCLISAASVLETHLVLSRRLPLLEVKALVWELIAALGIEVVPVTAEIAMAAVEALGKYGKGYPPARLNFGDLLAYATAKTAGLPLLFKGDDFGLTDVTPAYFPGHI